MQKTLRADAVVAQAAGDFLETCSPGQHYHLLSDFDSGGNELHDFSEVLISPDDELTKAGMGTAR